ncbi:hypothetical protein TCAL_10199 [Tigriopus californicus]|uniref:Uncharacterized protein n=1 Tax=Tigriopus californicus TaxID=6832 RepID=A0A553PHX3_TIGCA|nr:hypothetical protein TCAL_10199 [Tigriopus californicus]|eukprot:TCALIF_10199-PA protein Name:"Protein of unknown function" AED:0.37 eAED:0.37 QI:201/0.5/0.33/0.66/0/0/3/0/270
MAGREKYKVSWEQEFQWLSTAPTDDSSSWCKVCKKKLMNKKSVLVGHSKTTEHVERIKAVDKTPKLHNSTLRRENYKALYDAIGDLDAEEGEITTNLMPFLKVSTTRWLVRGRLISAIVLHWCTLKEYFLTAEQLSDQSARMKARFIKEMLCDDNNYLFFIFLEPIVKEVERVNAFFQSSKADPEQMVKELDLLHRSIKIRVKDANGTNLSLSRVDFGGAFMTMLMSLVRERGPRGDALQQSVYQNVKTRAQTFIETLLIQLEASMPVSQ